ncbi:MAG: hypothetical protein DRK00_03765, partial [Thermoprotei archaeon]
MREEGLSLPLTASLIAIITLLASCAPGYAVSPPPSWACEHCCDNKSSSQVYELIGYVELEAPKVLRAPVAGYDLVVMRSARPYMVPGAPIVPVKVLTYKLPYDARVEGVKVSVEVARLKG